MKKKKRREFRLLDFNRRDKREVRRRKNLERKLEQGGKKFTRWEKEFLEKKAGGKV